MTEKEFYQKYKLDALINGLKYGILPSITLAQASIESANGNSFLAKYGKNFFGIKAYSNPDNLPVIYANDDLQNEPFRKYNSVKESFKDHSIFLIENSRYKPLFDSTDFNYWADTLQAQGYATSPVYASTIKSRIKNNDLDKLDFIVKYRWLFIILGVALIIFILYLLYKYVIKKYIFA